MAKKIKQEPFITKCPKCGSRKYVMSIFGKICPDCFYEEKGEATKKCNWAVLEKILEDCSKNVIQGTKDFIRQQIQKERGIIGQELFIPYEAKVKQAKKEVVEEIEKWAKRYNPREIDIAKFFEDLLAKLKSL